MSLLTAENISHSYGGNTVLEGLSFSLENNSKIGIIGYNGCGKTTLFNIISGKTEPSKGIIHLSKNKKISGLTQDPQINENQTLYDFVLSSHQEFLQAKKELEKAEEAVARDSSSRNMKRLHDCQERFSLIDGYNFENMTESVLTRLNFPKEMWFKTTESFSGGEKTRVQLACVLLQPFDLLLLDEPTNHLDFEMIFWLEKHLQNLNKPYCIISHDRTFLDKTVNKIFEISNKKLTVYKGNYSDYVQQSIARREQLERMAKRQEKFIKKTENFIRKNIGSQKTAQAESRRKMLAKLNTVDKPNVEKRAKIKFKDNKRSGNDIFRMENSGFGFGNKKLGENINLNVFCGDRIALIGKNGCGKTSLLKIFAGEKNFTEGKFYRGTGLEIGYFDQHHINLNPELTVFDTVFQLSLQASSGSILSYLAKFGFRNDYPDRLVKNLSGGERAKLYLAVLIQKAPNLLLLDEPTNHLDLATSESLENALSDYKGTVIFVSHDREFIKKTATKTWFFNNKTVKETYLSPEELFAEENKKQNKAKSEKTFSKQKSNKKNPILIEKKTKELENAETILEKLKNQSENLSSELAKPENYTDSEKIKDLNKKLLETEKAVNEQKNKIEILEDEYLQMLED
ncbi:MAG: hypothetical protein CSB55_04790 [Candidatus Cloacimonadota bacterium]|nr:MAG: hypothetical protein CSB55_04790 [Candidatus Cloacimonadota bacterium]